MCNSYQVLIDHIVDKLKTWPSDQRLLVGLAGAPGTGKSFIAKEAAEKINEISGKEIAICIGIDGYHYYRSQIKDQPELIKHRGRWDTFDSDRYLQAIQKIKYSASEDIKLPSFDHAKKDPLEDGILVKKAHQVIIIEGNYVLFNFDKTPKFAEAAKLLDERWFVFCDSAVAKERVWKRHLEAGIEKTEDDAKERYDFNDAINGKFINSHITCPIDGLIYNN